MIKPIFQQLNLTTFKIPFNKWAEVEIGDKKANYFRSHAKIKRWGDECWMDIEISAEQESWSPITIQKEILAWQNSKKEVHFYPLKSRNYKEKDSRGIEHSILQNEEGGFEIETILNKKPLSNKIVFNIKTQGLKFYYQPELTQNEKEGGAFRPENVIGSYAVYHATRTNIHRNKEDAEKYKTGKAFHIYRPKVKDNQGREIWGKLEIDQQKEKLTITIDQDWLDNADYPVSIDPNFGYETGGNTSHSASGSDLRGSVFTSPADAVSATSITGWVRTVSGDRYIKGVIVLHSSLNILTNGVGNATYMVDALPDCAWITSTFTTPPVLSGNTNYVLMGIFNDSSTYHRYDAGDTNQGHDDSSNNYLSPINPTDAAHNNNKYSFYCTYVGLSSSSSYSSSSFSFSSSSFSSSSFSFSSCSSCSSSFSSCSSSFSSSSSSFSSSSCSLDATKLYSRGDYVDLPANNDNNLETAFSCVDYSKVITDNNIYIGQSAADQYSIILWKNQNTSDRDVIVVTWKGKSSLAPTSYEVYLQIYNRNFAQWETLAFNNYTIANTEFTLKGTQSTNLSDYYDGGNWVSCRVYQSALESEYSGSGAQAAQTEDSLAVRTPLQGQSFYSEKENKYFVFFTKIPDAEPGKCYVHYTSSSDGKTSWSTPVKIEDIYWNYGAARFSICWDGDDYIHLVYSNQGTNQPLKYRRGVPQSNGTISWDAVQTVKTGVVGVNYNDPTIALDSNGYPWIMRSYHELIEGSHWHRIKVIKSSTKDGTWTEENEWELWNSGGGNNPMVGQITSLNSGRMYGSYSWTHSKVKGRLWNGSSWDTEEEITTFVTETTYMGHDSITLGDDIYMVYLADVNDTRQIRYLKRTYGIGWGSEELVQDTVAYNSIPVISMRNSNNNLFCFWTSTPIANYIYFKERSDSWDVNPTSWKKETILARQDDISCSNKNYGGKLMVLWESENSSPYWIRVGILDIA